MKRAAVVTLIVVAVLGFIAVRRETALIQRADVAEAQAREAAELTDRCLVTSEGLAGQLRRAEDDLDRLRARR
jgi:Tfp pilus assembly protein PilE